MIDPAKNVLLFCALSGLLYSVAANPIEKSEVSFTTRNSHRQGRQEEDTDYVDNDTGPIETVAGTTSTGTGVNNGTSGNNIGYLYSPSEHIGQVLNAAFNGDISPILAGGTAFIPPGELRQGLSALLVQQIAPQVQKIFMNVGTSIQSQLNGTAPTSSPTQNNQIPLTPEGSPSQTETSTKTTITIPNPLEALRNTFQGNSNQNSTSPFESIRNRLQNLIPINIQFGSSSGTTTNSPANNNAISNNAPGYNNNNFNFNNFGNSIPSSPVD